MNGGTLQGIHGERNHGLSPCLRGLEPRASYLAHNPDPAQSNTPAPGWYTDIFLSFLIFYFLHIDAIHYLVTLFGFGPMKGKKHSPEIRRLSHPSCARVLGRRVLLS